MDLKSKALEGYFVRDLEQDVVYCPQGQMLRRKSVTKAGAVRYCCKKSCSHCLRRCTTSKWKVIEFSAGVVQKPQEGRKIRCDSNIVRDGQQMLVFQNPAT